METQERKFQFDAQEWQQPPIPQVLVSMRDHALRRIVSNALRADGLLVVEAFDIRETLEELRRSHHPVRSILLDARRDNFHTLVDVARIRAVDLHVPVIALSVRPDEAFENAAHRYGASVVHLPTACRDLREVIGK